MTLEERIKEFAPRFGEHGEIEIDAKAWAEVAESMFPADPGRALNFAMSWIWKNNPSPPPWLIESARRLSPNP